MSKTAHSENYEAWLDANRKLARKGDEEAQSRIRTASRLQQAEFTRKYYDAEENRK